MSCIKAKTHAIPIMLKGAVHQFFKGHGDLSLCIVALRGSQISCQSLTTSGSPIKLEVDPDFTETALPPITSSDGGGQDMLTGKYRDINISFSLPFS